MKCTACGFSRKGKPGKTCPGCGVELTPTVKEEKVIAVDGEATEAPEEDIIEERGILVSDKDGCVIRMGKETHCGFWLKIGSKPTMYPKDYKSVLKWIREAKVEVQSNTVKSLDKLIEIEEKQIAFIEQICKTMMENAKELSVK